LEVGRCGGDGFFEQDIQASVEEREGSGDVEVIHGAVDDGGGELLVRKKCVEGGEAVLGGDLVGVGKGVAAERVGVDDGGDLHFLRVRQGVGSVKNGSMAGAEDCDLKWRRHEGTSK